MTYKLQLICSEQVNVNTLYIFQQKILKMGNAQARRRLNAKDFQYIAKNTALLSMQMVTEYFTDLINKYPDGKMEVEDFKKIFHLAFPERKEAKVDQLAEKLRNIEKTDGTIRKLNHDMSKPTTGAYSSNVHHRYAALLVF